MTTLTDFASCISSDREEVEQLTSQVIFSSTKTSHAVFDNHKSLYDACRKFSGSQKLDVFVKTTCALQPSKLLHKLEKRSAEHTLLEPQKQSAYHKNCELFEKAIVLLQRNPKFEV
jgi:hypothetical protein